MDYHYHYNDARTGGKDMAHRTGYGLSGGAGIAAGMSARTRTRARTGTRTRTRTMKTPLRTCKYKSILSSTSLDIYKEIGVSGLVASAANAAATSPSTRAVSTTTTSSAFEDLQLSPKGDSMNVFAITMSGNENRTSNAQIGWNNPPVTKRYTPNHEKTAVALQAMLQHPQSPKSETLRDDVERQTQYRHRHWHQNQNQNQNQNQHQHLQRPSLDHHDEQQQQQQQQRQQLKQRAQQHNHQAEQEEEEEAEEAEEGEGEEYTTEEQESSSSSSQETKSLHEYETFASLEPPMTYNRNKHRLFIAISHRADLSINSPRHLLGVNAYRWSFLYASKDFTDCFKIYAPSPYSHSHSHSGAGAAPEPTPTDAIMLTHEPIRPQEIIVESIDGLPKDENFLGLVLLSKVSAEVPLARIIDELLRVRLTTTAPTSGRVVPHTPATWLWAAVKRLRRMSRSLVPNAVDDLESRALRFADKRMKAVMGGGGEQRRRWKKKRCQRTHWILNITDLGKPVACPADLGDTWQKVCTKLFGEATTIQVQRRMRQLGLTEKLR